MKIPLIIFIGCTLNFALAENRENSKTENEEITLLFNAKHDKIWQVGLDGNEKELTKTSIPIYLNNENSNDALANIIDFDYDYSSNRVIWMSWNEKIFATDLNKPNDKYLFWNDFREIISTRRITVDSINKKLYLIDRFDPPTIEVTDFEGKNRSITNNLIALPFYPSERYKYILDKNIGPPCIRTNKYLPMTFGNFKLHQLVLDPYEGLMFAMIYYAHDTWIEKLNMDGSGTVNIVDWFRTVDANCTRMDIDYHNKRLYWVDCDEQTIKSVDYGGKNQMSVVKAPNVFAMAVYNNYLFWSTNATDISVERKINVCKLVDNECNEKHIRTIPIKGMNGKAINKIKAVGKPLQKQVNNPCLTNNGGCAHECLIRAADSSSGLTHTCICKVGFRLAPNKKDCIIIRKFLVYEKSNRMYGKDVEDENPGNYSYFAFPPKSVKGVMKIDEGNAYSGDWPDGSKFTDCHFFMLDNWYSSDAVYRLNCHHVDGFCYSTFHDATSSSRKSELSYFVNRWVDKKDDYFTISVGTFSARKNRPILRVIHEYPSYDLRILSLVYDEKREHVYMVTLNKDSNNKNVLHRMETSSIVKTQEIDLGDNNVTGLAINHLEDRLYWYTNKGMIGYLNLKNEKEVKVLTKSPLEDILSMTVDDQWIYVKNFTSIWRLNKLNGYKASIFIKQEKEAFLQSNMVLVEHSTQELHAVMYNSKTDWACKSFCHSSVALKDIKSVVEDKQVCRCT